MGESFMDQAATTHVETMLRAELARGDRALGGVAPVLTHMLASSGHTLVNEDIIARLRGMLSDCARQLLMARDQPGTSSLPDQLAIDELADHLAADGPVLSHFYALAMEGHLSHRLEQRSSLDPVLSPLLQELIASEEPETAELAMLALAAQSRFVQAQRRMAMPVTELPAGLFHAVLERWQTFGRRDTAPDTGLGTGLGTGQFPDETSRKLRIGYDEAATRLGLFARLVASMRAGAIAGLELDHAGLALFVTALGALTRQPRDLAILACHDRQAARLALGLRAAGLDERSIERQFLLLEPAERMPRHMGQIAPDQAADLLGSSAAWKGA